MLTLKLIKTADSSLVVYKGGGSREEGGGRREGGGSREEGGGRREEGGGRREEGGTILTNGLLSSQYDDTFLSF